MTEHQDEPRIFDPNDFDWNSIYTGEASDYEPPNPMILSAVESLEPGRAVDIGCGAGGLAIALAERGWQVTGIDIASKAIAAARSAAKERGASVQFTVVDATEWRTSEQLDLVVSSFALPARAKERAALFETIGRALKPGGTVVIEDFDPGMLRQGFFRNTELVSLDEYRTAFEGFEIVTCDVVDTPPHDHDGSGAHAGEHWTAALLHARKPRGAERRKA